MKKKHFINRNPKIIVTSEVPNLSKEEKEHSLIIGTHSGTFHSDEVVAIALYSFTKPYEKIYVVRSRDKDILSKCDISVDYGGGDYDHHIPGYNERRANNGTKYASAGLVYIHDKLGKSNTIVDNFFSEANILDNLCELLKKSGISDDKINTLSSELEKKFPTIKQSIINDIDYNIIVPVDARDTGEKLNPPREDILDFIPSFNPSWCEENSSDNYNAKFKEALITARQVLLEKIKETISNTYETILPDKISEKTQLKIKSKPISAQKMCMNSLLSFLPNSNTPIPQSIDEAEKTDDYNLEDVWNNYSEQIILNAESKINPKDSIFRLYSDFKADGITGEQYKSIAPVIRKNLEEKKAEIRASIRDSVYNELISPITGQSSNSENTNEPKSKNPLSFIDAFNPSSFDQNPDLENQLTNAKKVSDTILTAKIQEIISREYAKETIKTLYENPSFFSDGILELPSQSIPWKETVCYLNSQIKDPSKSINYVVFPYPDGGWACQAVPPSLENEFEKRFPLLKKAGSKLIESSPKLWVHPGKFFARFAETKEDAIELCKSSKDIQDDYIQLIDKWKNYYNDDELDLYEKD